MFIRYRTKGFVIKKEDRGEADQLFTIYTKDFGKLDILGKAIRKTSSKLRSGAEIFYLSEVEFIQGKAYKTLTDVVLIEKFKNIGQDLRKLKIAYKISEVLDKMIRGQEPDGKIWQLLIKTFERLNKLEAPKSSADDRDGGQKASPWNLEILLYYFLWNFLSILGYHPELQRCSFCQKKLIPQRIYFNPREGGTICQSCFIKLKVSPKTVKEISPEIIKILRIILNEDWQTLLKLKIESDYLKSLKLVSQDYFSKILETIE